MKIFLTGGAGFIGSHIADSLVKEGHEVMIYDNFSNGHEDNLKDIIDKIKLIKGDILNKEMLFDYCPQDVDIISHQAAQLEIFKCIEDPVVDLTVNTIGTLNILELARIKKIKKVINASSACVYGQAQYIPQDEKHPTLPNWPYGASKLLAEHYGRIYMENYDIKVVSLRYGIVYGPREWHGRALTMFLSRIYQKKDPVVFGDGNCSRDFINVYDVVDFHKRCLTTEEVFGNSFNIGTGVGTTIRDLAEKVCNILTECNITPVFEDVKEGNYSKNMPTRKRIPQELQKMVLSNKFAEKVTGFKPKISLEQGIKEEYTWICQNSHRWDMEGIVKV